MIRTPLTELSIKILILFSLFILLFSFYSCKPRTQQTEIQRIIPQETQQKEYINYIEQGGELELPVNGATGYTALDLNLYSKPNEDSNPIAILLAGRGFTILKEDGEYWFIQVSDLQGWIKHHFCMINIPDVIPSIVHNNTNTYSSLFKTSGYDIPNITGRALYNMKDYNNRLRKEEYIQPVLYGMVKKIFLAQQLALADGNTLVIYEAFRPAEPHEILFNEMTKMVQENEEIRLGVDSQTFRMDLFLAPAPYNHQRGTAIDVSLAKIIKKETRFTGDYLYTQITEYEEYPMQSPMHELSIRSAIFKRWVNARTFTGWHQGEFRDIVTEGSKILQKYCTNAGLTPLATEWWHFNDLNWSPPLVDVGMTGEFYIEKSYSLSPL